MGKRRGGLREMWINEERKREEAKNIIKKIEGVKK